MNIQRYDNSQLAVETWLAAQYGATMPKVQRKKHVTTQQRDERFEDEKNAIWEFLRKEGPKTILEVSIKMGFDRNATRGRVSSLFKHSRVQKAGTRHVEKGIAPILWQAVEDAV